MIAALFAASSVFVGCSSDPSDAPTITIRFDGNASTNGVFAPSDLYVGDNVAVEVEFDVPGKIKEIRISEVGGSPLAGYPKTSGFTSDNFHKANWTVTGNSVGTVEFNVEVTDKDKEPNIKNASIKITFKERPPVYGEIKTSTAKLLGAQNHTEGSSYSTETEGVYKVSEVLANAGKIDFIYYYQTGGSLAEIFSPKSANAGTLNTIKDMNPKNDTRLKKVTLSENDFNNIENDGKIVELATDFPTGADGESVKELVVGNVVAFKTDDDRLGLFRVTALEAGANGSITIIVKVQE